MGTRRESWLARGFAGRWGFVLLLAVSSLSGCAASDVPVRPLGHWPEADIEPPVEDRELALAFTAEHIHRTQLGQSRPEQTRRDASLSAGQGSQVRLALDTWADGDRDSLARSRTLTIPRGHDRFLYFDAPTRGGRSHGAGDDRLWHPAPRW